MPVKPGQDEPSGGGFSAAARWLFIVGAVLIVLNLMWGGEPRPENTVYSTFVQQVQSNQVSSALIGPDAIVYGLKSEETPLDAKSGVLLPDGLGRFSTVHSVVPVQADRQLVPLLREHKVRFSAQPPERASWWGAVAGWIVPALLLFAFWGWILRRSQVTGPLTVGKSRARIYNEGQTGIRFDQVAGVDEAKAELEEVVDFLKNASKYTRVGARIPKGVLLVGPPGTGKTLLAKAVAGEASVPFYSISGAEFIELFVGVGASRVRDLFEQAKQKAPCIVFIDELDALGKSRASYGGMIGGNDEREQTLNQLLTEMDGFEPNNGVVILAATNRPEILDPALRRPGRFDRIISVDAPDRKGRLAILQVHVRNVPLDPDVDLEAIARRTPGFVGADLANLVNEAALLTARENRTTITAGDFNEAIERVVAGLEKKSRILSEKERDIVAHHEAGHATVGAVMPGSARVEKISIVPRGMAALGFTWQIPQEEHFLLQEDELRGKLASLLGGRTCELLLYGRLSTGAGDDLQKATDLAEQAVTVYGMSRLGPMTFEKVQQQYMDLAPGPRRGVGPQTAQGIDAEVHRFLVEAQWAADEVLKANLDVVRALGTQLQAHEVLEGPDLQALLSQAKLPPSVAAWLNGGPAPKDENPLLEKPHGMGVAE